jgi:predicted nuclease with RNAse H fold
MKKTKHKGACATMIERQIEELSLQTSRDLGVKLCKDIKELITAIDSLLYLEDKVIAAVRLNEFAKYNVEQAKLLQCLIEELIVERAHAAK